MQVKLIKPYCGFIAGDIIGISGRRGRLLIDSGVGVCIDPEPVEESPKIETAESKRAAGRKKAVRK